MKWTCTEKCYFLSTLWENGQIVEGEQFVKNKYFEPIDNEALDLCQKSGRDAEVQEFFEPEFVPDPELMKKSVQELRAEYYYVEWKPSLRKADFVKAIMNYVRGSQHMQ